MKNAILVLSFFPLALAFANHAVESKGDGDQQIAATAAAQGAPVEGQGEIEKPELTWNYSGSCRNQDSSGVSDENYELGTGETLADGRKVSYSAQQVRYKKLVGAKNRWEMSLLVGDINKRCEFTLPDNFKPQDAKKNTVASASDVKCWDAFFGKKRLAGAKIIFDGDSLVFWSEKGKFEWERKENSAGGKKGEKFLVHHNVLRLSIPPTGKNGDALVTNLSFKQTGKKLDYSHYLLRSTCTDSKDKKAMGIDVSEVGSTAGDNGYHDANKSKQAKLVKVAYDPFIKAIELGK